MFSKWLQNDLGLSWNLILFHLIPNEPCIPNYSSIGHLVLHGLQMASVWDETWYSSISTQMHPAYQISDHLDHWYRFWNLGNICIGRKTSHAPPPFLFFFTYDSEVRPTLDYPFLKELEFLCIKKLRIFAWTSLQGELSW